MPSTLKSGGLACALLMLLFAAGCHDDTPPSDTAIVPAPPPAISVKAAALPTLPKTKPTPRAKAAPLHSRYLQTDAAGIIIVPRALQKTPNAGH